MRINVVVGDLVNAFVAFAAHVHAGLERVNGGFLGAKNDIINFALARREFSVGGNGTSDIGGVTGVLRGHIHDHNVSSSSILRESLS